MSPGSDRLDPLNNYGISRVIRLGWLAGLIFTSSLWASKWGFYVHQRAEYLAFGSHLTLDQLGIMADAHAFIDSAHFQTGVYAFIHAMRGPGETAEQDCRMADQFVRRQFSRAWEAQRGGNMDHALFLFTLGLHTLQDSTSPSHIGFQQWTGQETPIDELIHALIELGDRGTSTPLDRITRDAWRWFQAGQLP